jgi:hypothetical protein
LKKDNKTQYSYTLKHTDHKKTFWQLVNELWFNDFSDFEKIIQPVKINITKDGYILKAYIWKKIHIII